MVEEKRGRRKFLGYFADYIFEKVSRRLSVRNPGDASQFALSSDDGGVDVEAGSCTGHEQTSAMGVLVLSRSAHAMIFFRQVESCSSYRELQRPQ
jgi:hypothetical protein